MLGGRGGRHGGLLTWEKDEVVLAETSDRALNGLVAITQPIQVCFERRLGRVVPGSGSGASLRIAPAGDRVNAYIQCDATMGRRSFSLILTYASKVMMKLFSESFIVCCLVQGGDSN